jgi:hypothetical protein
MRLRKKTTPSSGLDPQADSAGARMPATAAVRTSGIAQKEPAAVRQGLSASDLIAMARSARRQASQA